MNKFFKKENNLIISSTHLKQSIDIKIQSRKEKKTNVLNLRFLSHQTINYSSKKINKNPFWNLD